MSEVASPERTAAPAAPKVGFVSLGCPKALTDSELILTQLSAEGYQTSVKLMTLHSSKGLEFPVVFMVGMEEGLFPSIKPWEETPDEDIEEERRLFYVSVTRAKDELYLTYPCVSYSQGYGDPLQRPSRFLLEIPKPLTEEWEVGGVF